MIFGIIVGTYSSIFIAAPVLILFNLRPGQIAGNDKEKSDAEKEKRQRPIRRPSVLNKASDRQEVMKRGQRGIEIREAHFPGRAPIEAYGNGGFRFAGMSHVGSIDILTIRDLRLECQNH